MIWQKWAKTTGISDCIIAERTHDLQLRGRTEVNHWNRRGSIVRQKILKQINMRQKL